MIELTIVRDGAKIMDPHKLSVRKEAVIAVRDFSRFAGPEKSQIYLNLTQLAYSDDDSQVANENIYFGVVETREQVLQLLEMF